jgi:hypothetical protein
MKIKIYSDEQLQQIIARATENQTREQWMAKALKNLARFIKSNPNEYRTFGAWWWAIKRQLVDAGLLTGSVNLEMFNAITTGDTEKDMAGALAYHEYTADSMYIGNHFQFSTEEGDTIDYVLDDQEMELRAFARSA